MYEYDHYLRAMTENPHTVTVFSIWTIGGRLYGQTYILIYVINVIHCTALEVVPRPSVEAIQLESVTSSQWDMMVFS